MLSALKSYEKWSMYAKYKVPISYALKNKEKVKFHKNKQTDRKKINMLRRHKIYNTD